MREVWITFKELVDLTVCVNHQAVAELNVGFFEISPNKEGKLVMSAGRFIGKEKFKRECYTCFTSEPFDHFTYHEEAQTINLEMY